MKKIFYFCLMLVVLASCGKNGGTSKRISLVEGAAVQSLFADQTALTPIKFRTHDAWQVVLKNDLGAVVESVDWLNCSPKQGDKAGDYTMNITLSKNNSSKQRKASIEIVCGVDKVTIAVTQSEKMESGELPFIQIKNKKVKEIILANWDSDKDGQFSFDEAAAVTSLDGKFKGASISEFTELKYFTSLTEIAKSDFEGSEITIVAIPKNVITLKPRAFKDCAMLRNVTIEAGSKLEKIEGALSQLESGLKVDEGAFSGCKSLLAVDVPNTVKEIGECAFSGCVNIKSINIPNGVTIISKRAFSSSGLLELTIPESVETIAEEAFYGCGFKDVVIPNSVKNIEKKAFIHCVSMTSVKLPNELVEIGSSVFFGCKGLLSVEFPSTLKAIRSYAFSNCKSLSGIVIPNSVETVEQAAFAGCTQLKSAVLPDGLTNIGNAVFSDCATLNSIIIPSQVSSIDSSAFSRCVTLSEIIIPESVKSIASRTFDGCAALTSVVLVSTTPPSLAANVFENIEVMPTIKVPASAVDAYKSADGWVELKDYIVAQ